MTQESMYQSFQERDKNKKMAAIDDDIIYLCHLLQEEEEEGDEEEEEGECSRHEGVMTQEAIDEALARSLQELGEGFDDIIISEHSGTASGLFQLTTFNPK